MGRTVLEKIIAAHLTEVSKGSGVRPGDIVDIAIDIRAARDFGGANVVQNLRQQKLNVADPAKTFFTFDCNPTGSDQQYAANQHACRLFAREQGVKVYDIDKGIGTHIVMDERVVRPGSTFVSTDSHANIVGGICAFGQGMGDVDIAAAWARGSVWFKVPKSMRVVLKGMPSPVATPKDVALVMLKHFGANGMLGYAAELSGEYVDTLDLSGRATISSLGTEMAAIIVLMQPSAAILQQFGMKEWTFQPDADAVYDKEVVIDITGLGPMMSRPGKPEDAVPVATLKGKKVDSCFIGSCTNGRIEDLRAAAAVLRGKKIAPGVVLKVVPSTRGVWEAALAEGVLQALFAAGALVGNAGCAGCAAGQIGQNGPKEVTISSGNRNFAGKQGKGEVFLASPATVAACALAGCITTADDIPAVPVVVAAPSAPSAPVAATPCCCGAAAAKPEEKPLVLKGRAWVVGRDNIDTDMIFHNKWLAITDRKEMGPHTFGNLKGWEDFPTKAKAGDIVVVGRNFGCGSSRQQAVDCFLALGVTALVGTSFGAIYERNAINAGLPLLPCAALVTEGPEAHVCTGDELEVDLQHGTIKNLTKNAAVPCDGFNPVQLDIYKRGGLLCGMDW
eukprot:TRINITY_DN5892_c0_g1_i1.p1 TRINITY_DN5892_c0_g1~~TRINITY_DN5892_c0_g1_i1.p1  ORF type:complete len:618 (-),score=192.90 TRINITY_DN5892_c0_g1_i1:763-2616(-)